MLLLDTSGISALMHRRPHAVRQLRDEDPSVVYLCMPLAAEIYFGMSRLESDSRCRLLLASESQRLRDALR